MMLGPPMLYFGPLGIDSKAKPVIRRSGMTKASVRLGRGSYASWGNNLSTSTGRTHMVELCVILYVQCIPLQHVPGCTKERLLDVSAYTYMDDVAQVVQGLFEVPGAL